MDLRLFLGVVVRFKLLVVTGFLLATALAFLSFVKVDFSGGIPSLSHRGEEVWASNARLLVAAPGFTVGTARPTVEEGEAEGRLPGLAAIYSSFVTSDAVLRIMREQGPVRGTISAVPLPAAPGSSEVLPVVNITALDRTEEDAISLAARAAAALQIYVRRQQEANKEPAARRIELRPMNAAFAPELIEPRSKTMPIVIFAGLMFTFLSIAFLLENLRPRRIVNELGAIPIGEHLRPGPETPRDRAQHTA